MTLSTDASTVVPGQSPELPASQPQHAYLALLTLALTIASGSAMRMVFSPVQELAKADLALSDFEISLVQGLAASLPIALLALPIGRAVDRVNRVRMLVAMAVTWTLGSVCTAYADGFYALFLSRMLAAVGAVCAIPVAISIAADLSQAGQRGRSLMLLSFGQMVGAAMAFAVAGWMLGWFEMVGSLVSLAPWRGVHLGFALASALLLLPLLLLHEPARKEIGESHHAATSAALGAIWARRRFLIPLFLGQVTVVMADTAAGIWAAPVLMRDYALRPEDFAGWMGLVILLSGILGSLLGGFASDLGHGRRIRGGLLGGAVVAALCSIPGAFFPVMPTVEGFALMLTLLLTCGAATGLITATAIAVLIPNEIRGICLGAFVVIGAVVGLGLAPTLVTLVSSAMGGESFIRYALTTAVAVTSVAALVGFTWALRRAPAPVAGVEPAT